MATLKCSLLGHCLIKKTNKQEAQISQR